MCMHMLHIYKVLAARRNPSKLLEVGRALMGWALMGPPGLLSGPCGPPWAIMGQALMGRALMGFPGLLWAGSLWARLL